MKKTYENFIEEYELFLHRVKAVHADIVERTEQHRNYIANLNKERFDSLYTFVGYDQNGNDLTQKKLDERYAALEIVSQEDIIRTFDETRDDAIRAAKKQPAFINNPETLEMLINQNGEKLNEIQRREDAENEEYAKFIKEKEEKVLIDSFLMELFRNEAKSKRIDYENDIAAKSKILDPIKKCTAPKGTDEHLEAMKKAREYASLYKKVNGMGYEERIKSYEVQLSGYDKMFETYDKVANLYNSLVNSGVNPQINAVFDHLDEEIENALKELDEIKMEREQATEFIISINENQEKDCYEIVIRAPYRGKRSVPYEIDKKEFTREALNDYIMQTYFSMAFEDSKELTSSILLNGRFAVAAPVSEVVDTFAIQELLQDNKKNIDASVEPINYNIFANTNSVDSTPDTTPQEEVEEKIEETPDEEEIVEELEENQEEEEIETVPEQDEKSEEKDTNEVEVLDEDLKDLKNKEIDKMTAKLQELCDIYGEEAVENSYLNKIDNDEISNMLNNSDVSPEEIADFLNSKYEEAKAELEEQKKNEELDEEILEDIDDSQEIVENVGDEVSDMNLSQEEINQATNIALNRNNEFDLNKVYYKVTKVRQPKEPGKVKRVLKTAFTGLVGGLVGTLVGGPVAGVSAGIIGATVGANDFYDIARNIVNNHYMKKLQKLVDKVNDQMTLEADQKGEKRSKDYRLKFVEEEITFIEENKKGEQILKEETIIRPAIFYGENEINAETIQKIYNFNEKKGINIQAEINSIFKRRLNHWYDARVRKELNANSKIRIDGQDLSLPYNMLHFGFGKNGGFLESDEIVQEYGLVRAEELVVAPVQPEGPIDGDEENANADSVETTNEGNNINVIFDKVNNGEEISDEEAQMLVDYIDANRDSINSDAADDLMAYLESRNQPPKGR